MNKQYISKTISNHSSLNNRINCYNELKNLRKQIDCDGFKTNLMAGSNIATSLMVMDYDSHTCISLTFTHEIADDFILNEDETELDPDSVILFTTREKVRIRKDK